MKRILLSALLGLALAACAGEPEMQHPNVGATPEKLMLAALTKVEASDAQRLAVFSAFDSRNTELVALEKQSRQIVAQWNKLDRTAPDFIQQVDALATQWSELNGKEMRARAAYEHELATQLSSRQWSQWQDFMRSVGEAQRRAELFGDERFVGRGGGR